MNSQARGSSEFTLSRTESDRDLYELSDFDLEKPEVIRNSMNSCAAKAAPTEKCNPCESIEHYTAKQRLTV